MNDEDIAVKSLATAFQFGVALGFAKKYDEMHEVVEEVKKAIISERESCEDAVSRQTVLDIVNNPLNIRLDEIIKKLPSVIPQPRTGHWIDKDIRGSIEPYCSVCGDSVDTIYHYNYCPNCGAKMEADK